MSDPCGRSRSGIYSAGWVSACGVRGRRWRRTASGSVGGAIPGRSGRRTQRGSRPAPSANETGSALTVTSNAFYGVPKRTGSCPRKRRNQNTQNTLRKNKGCKLSAQATLPKRPEDACTVKSDIPIFLRDRFFSLPLPVANNPQQHWQGVCLPVPRMSGIPTRGVVKGGGGGSWAP